MPTSAIHAVVARRRRRGDGDRCRLPPAPQRAARCCRHRRRPAVGHRAQARCCRRRRRSLAKPSEDTVLVRPTRTGSPPRSRRRRDRCRPPPAPLRAQCCRRPMLSSPPSMPTSAMHAVVARRRRGDGDRCRPPPAPQRARCCRRPMLSAPPSILG